MTDTAAGAPGSATPDAAAAVFPGPGEIAARCRAFDWAATPLGPVETWPAALRTVAGLVLAAPTAMVVLWGPALVQIYNDGYREVMGAKHPAGLGQPTRDCWPEVWAFNAPLYEGVMERREAFTFEDQRLVVERHRHPEEAFFTLTFSPVPDDAGDVGGVLVSVFETTAQVRARGARELERERLLEAERAARAEAERRAAELTAVIESMGEAVYIGGAEGITLANQAALDQLGFATPAELDRHIGALAAEIQTRDAETGAFIPVERQAFARAFAGERVVQDVVVRHRGTGEDRVVRCAAAPVVLGGRVVAAVAVNTDVTDIRRAAVERARLLAESEAARAEAEVARSAAEAASRAKGEFLAVMSHELRTPLNAIGGYAELIELGIHGPVTDAQRTALDRIQRSQRALLSLINEVLNYARLETGAVTYDLAAVPVAEAVSAAEVLVAPQLRAKGLAYVWGGCDPGLRVRADRDKLQQVLLNLLSNAVKFTEAVNARDGRPGRVEVSCAAAAAAGDGAAHGGVAEAGGAGGVAIRVRDTGIGIPADKLGAVFEPFVQVDQALTRPQQGTGLGLAISRDLARGMGGDLTAESTPGAGSTFTLMLPRA